MVTPRTRPTIPLPEWLNDRDAARYIGMSTAYLRADRSRGRVRGTTPGPAYHRKGRTIQYRREDLDAWLSSCRIDRSASAHPRDSRARRAAP
jgi:hypothetical protein